MSEQRALATEVSTPVEPSTPPVLSASVLYTHWTATGPVSAHARLQDKASTHCCCCLRVQAKLSEAQRSHAAAVQQLQASHAKAMRKAEASHAAAMAKVQTEAEGQLEGLRQQMEQLKQDVQAQLAERSDAESSRLKELEQR